MQGCFDKNLMVEKTTFDKNMRVYDVTKEPFSFHGNSKTAKNVYARMNEKSSEKFPEIIRRYGGRCTGVRIRFKTDSKRIGVRASLFVPFLAPSSSLITALALDIYSGNKFIKSIYPETINVRQDNIFEQVIEIEGGLKDITIYFPYDTVVNAFCIALDKEAKILSCTEYRDIPPIVFYGSSITHGYCVSRPGVAFTSIISRKLNMDYRNLGFSGACRGEMEMADYLASLKKSVLVCEYDHNEPTAEELSKKHFPFYRRIRETDKETPILFISRPDVHNFEIDCRRMEIVENTYKYALEQGDDNVYFINGLTLFQEECRYDCTVDTYHPNDLGAYMIAEKLAEKLKQILVL